MHCRVPSACSASGGLRSLPPCQFQQKPQLRLHGLLLFRGKHPGELARQRDHAQVGQAWLATCAVHGGTPVHQQHGALPNGPDRGPIPIGPAKRHRPVPSWRIAFQGAKCDLEQSNKLSSPPSKMKKKTISDELVVSKIYTIRGQKVMLDRDLAELYDGDLEVTKCDLKSRWCAVRPDGFHRAWGDDVVQRPEERTSSAGEHPDHAAVRADA